MLPPLRPESFFASRLPSFCLLCGADDIADFSDRPTEMRLRNESRPKLDPEKREIATHTHTDRDGRPAQRVEGISQYIDLVVRLQPREEERVGVLATEVCQCLTCYPCRARETSLCFLVAAAHQKS